MLSCTARTAVNLPPPSSVLFGAQHMRMLEAMHARIPQRAPTTPGMPPAKPIIEKMELPHTRACAVYVQCEVMQEQAHSWDERVRSCVHVHVSMCRCSALCVMHMSYEDFSCRTPVV